MILRTSWEVNRNGWGACERAVKLHLSRKGLSGKAKAKTGIGKSDLPGLQGGPRKRDFVLGQSARASALSRLAPANSSNRRRICLSKRHRPITSRFLLTTAGSKMWAKP
jgi:hypothetical protein